MSWQEGVQAMVGTILQVGQGASWDCWRLVTAVASVVCRSVCTHEHHNMTRRYMTSILECSYNAYEKSSLLFYSEHVLRCV
jgi:hypothetical protein